ncbi:MAG: XrtA/PEP-CTERM system TPR-repeat protein PrsT [Pseudomonadota bacterium]
MQQTPGRPDPLSSPTTNGLCRLSLNLVVACLLTFSLIMPALAGYLEDAQQEIDNNDPRTAIIHLRNALKDNPDNVQARSLLGELLLNQGKITAARDHLNRAFETTPDPDIAALLGDTLLAEGEPETALHFAKRQKKRFQSDVGRLPLLEAKALLSLRRPNDAASALAPFLQKHPLDVQALVLSSRVQIATGHLARATASIARAIDIDPTAPQVLWAKVDVDAASGRFALAHADVDRLAEQEPGNPLTEVARSGIFISAGRLSEARKRLEAVLTKQPDMPSASLMLANIMAAEGDYAGAQRQLDRLDRRVRESKPYLLLSGLANAVEQRYAVAETLLTSYLEQSPGDYAARRLLGNVQLNAGLNSSAITTLAPLAAEPNVNMSDLQLLASAEIRAGRLDDAAITLSRLIEEGPTPVVEQAQSLLDMLQNEDLGHHRHDAALALDYIHYGDSEKAHEVLESLTVERPHDVTMLNLMGIARFRAGDEGGARETFTAILDIDPRHEEALRALDQLDYRAGNFDVLEQRLKKRLLEGEDRDPERTALDLASVLASRDGDQAVYDFLTEAALHQPNSIALRTAAVRRAAALGRPVGEEPWLQQLKALGEAGAEEAYRRLGDLAGRFDLPILAAEAYAGLVAITPDDPESRVALARAFYVLGAQDKVRLQSKAALEIDPTHETANRILVELDLETGDHNRARRHIEALESKAPAFSQELSALFHIRTGQQAKAFDILESALSAFGDPGLAHALFIHRLQAGQGEKAIEGLRAWLVREPSDAVAMDLLGDVYAQAGELGLALRYYEQASAISSDNPLLLNDLGWVRHALGLPGAADMAKRAYAMAPLPEIADTLGWILIREGDLDIGLPLLREAFGARPDNPTIRYHLAFALAKDEKPDEAQAALERLVQDDPPPFAEREDALALWARLTTTR